MLACRPVGRGQSLGRFLGAAFLGFGLLLLLVGTQQSLPPALAGGGACIFAGLALLAVVRGGRAPLLILDGEHGEAILCRRRLGRRAFRLFSLTNLEITTHADGGAVHVRPAGSGDAGREVPGLASRISDREWRLGMLLPAPAGEAAEAAACLEQWRRLACAGEPPALADACDATEFAALLGKGVPPALLQGLAGADAPVLSPEPDADRGEEMRERPLRAAAAPHPEIRRAPDLRDSRGNRDKRD
ncbi:hypothetical protein [Desulfovibrio sp.]|uniref:hypothetical protein n=1 Tax=Desulfovibrio sp. TaxID=885 RepID=UPI0023D6E5A7|nr:hypothetical protein [Desulfovibrio sp.]MDE7241584.1 hypothetical protein [Desulfovibrio sp.]